MNRYQNILPYWLALWLIPKFGFVLAEKLHLLFPRIQDLFQLPQQELQVRGVPEFLFPFLKNPDWHEVETCLRWAEQPEHFILTWQDEDYSKLLKEISSVPFILFGKGDVNILNEKQIAMVGSRHPTPTGVETAFHFAKLLAENNIVITSGLAYGIDAASHRGALAGKGNTIAVMGTGLNHVYPARHSQLAEQILQTGGTLLSEFSPKTAPKPEYFPRRNRIISGLSLGTLVIEAALQSGSLITAKYALEQGREVFAIPGSIHNPMSRGCHALIKQGAKLVETLDDILEEFGLLSSTDAQKTFQNHENQLKSLDKSQIKLVECLGFETTPIDVLMERSGLSIETITSQLMMLELQGFVKAANGGYIRIGKI